MQTSNILITARKAASYQRVWHGHITKSGVGIHHKIQKHTTAKGLRPPDDLRKCEKLIKYILSHYKPLPKAVSNQNAEKTGDLHTNDKAQPSHTYTAKAVDKNTIASQTEDLEQLSATLATATNEELILELKKAGLTDQKALNEYMQNLKNAFPEKFDPKLNMDNTRPTEEDEPAQKIEIIKEPSLVEPEKADTARLLTAVAKLVADNGKRTPTEETKLKMRQDKKTSTDSDRSYKPLKIQNVKDDYLMYKNESENKKPVIEKRREECVYPAVLAMVATSNSTNGNKANKENTEIQSLKATVSTNLNQTSPKLPSYNDEKNDFKVHRTRIVKNIDEPKPLAAVDQSVDGGTGNPLAGEAKIHMIVDKADQNPIASSGTRVEDFASVTPLKSDANPITEPKLDAVNKLSSIKIPITESVNKLARSILSKYSEYRTDKEKCRITQTQTVEADRVKNRVSQAVVLNKPDKIPELEEKLKLICQAVLLNKPANTRSSARKTGVYEDRMSKAELEKHRQLKAPKAKSTRKARAAMTRSKFRGERKSHEKHKEAHAGAIFISSNLKVDRKSENAQQIALSPKSMNDKENLPTPKTLGLQMRNTVNQIGPKLPSYDVNCSKEKKKYDKKAEMQSTVPTTRIHQYDNNATLPLPKDININQYSKLQAPKVESTCKAELNKMNSLKSYDALEEAHSAVISSSSKSKEDKKSADVQKIAHSAKSVDDTHILPATPESLRSQVRNRINQIGPMLPNYPVNCSKEQTIDDPHAEHESTMPSIRIHEYKSNAILPLPKYANKWPENINQQGYGSWPRYGNSALYSNSQGYVNNSGFGYPQSSQALGNFAGVFQSPPYFGNESSGTNQPQGYEVSQGQGVPSGFGVPQGYNSEHNTSSGFGVSQWCNQPRGFQFFCGFNPPPGIGVTQCNQLQEIEDFPNSNPPPPGFAATQGYNQSEGFLVFPQSNAQPKPGFGFNQGSNSPQGSGVSQGPNGQEVMVIPTGSSILPGIGVAPSCFVVPQGSGPPPGFVASEEPKAPTGFGVARGFSIPTGHRVSQGFGLSSIISRYAPYAPPQGACMIPRYSPPSVLNSYNEQNASWGTRSQFQTPNQNNPYMNSWMTEYPNTLTNSEGVQNTDFSSGNSHTFQTSNSAHQFTRPARLPINPEFGNFPLRWAEPCEISPEPYPDAQLQSTQTGMQNTSPSQQPSTSNLLLSSQQLAATNQQVATANYQSSNQKVPTANHQPSYQQVATANHQSSNQQVASAIHQPSNQQVATANYQPSNQQVATASHQPSYQQVATANYQSSNQQVATTNHQPSYQQVATANYQPINQQPTTTTNPGRLPKIPVFRNFLKRWQEPKISPQPNSKMHSTALTYEKPATTNYQPSRHQPATMYHQPSKQQPTTSNQKSATNNQQSVITVRQSQSQQLFPQNPLKQSDYGRMVNVVPPCREDVSNKDKLWSEVMDLEKFAKKDPPKEQDDPKSKGVSESKIRQENNQHDAK